MRKLEKLLERPINALFWLAAIVTIIMMLHVVADVIGKQFFNTPIWGTLETVSGYYMVIVVFIPLAYVSRTEGHIIVELFTRHLPPRKLARLDGIVGIVTLLFMGLFTWLTTLEAIGRTVQGEVWDIADGNMIIWPSRWMLPIGGAAMTAYLLFRVIKDFRQAAGK